MSVKNKNSLQKIVRVSSKIIGETQRDITQFCGQQILRKARSILANDSHAPYPMFDTLPSGRRAKQTVRSYPLFLLPSVFSTM